MSMVARQGPSPFDAIRKEGPAGEFWSARDLQPLMGYARWNDFLRAIERATSSAANTGHDVELLFRASPEKETGGRPRMNYQLSRLAAYLIAMNGDPNKVEVAAAQAYFAAMTRQAEVLPAPAAPREITAAAGPVPYREQAEILSILRPVLPEAYATATGKVIMARVMGERPELEASETPLYASTFLAEKGHKPKTVAKFQSGFGSRVSNRYFKVHGRRPGKIPGPAGSRIDSVAFYTEDDRPILEQVYAEIADLIDDFEGGGQMRMSA
ncbi:hypothetical protein [Streptomyces lateritius]|uniref:hypothetical protein n=1 Tax=Streptomyces lateritius TaxID=67313 RepID=UPI001C8CD881|nr:hypothetical protein [Streptomyces lateritius]MBX9425457.1 hypothetical protein [Streptomyces lateritius]